MRKALLTVLKPAAFIALLIVAASDAVAESPDFSAAARVLEAAIADQAFPGCAVAVGSHERVIWSRGFGHLDYEKSAAVSPCTLYDIASLTKIVGTTSVVMSLVRDGKLAIADPVEKHFPDFVGSMDDDKQRQWRRKMTIEHLLTHSSGLPAGPRTPKDARCYADVLAGTLATPLSVEPGRKAVYSDAGYLLLAEIASRAAKKPLAAMEHELVLRPLEMNDTLRNPATSLHARIAPTEQIAGGERFWRGVVHDENARAGEGLTGHAGLFSNVLDLSRFAAEMLKAIRGESKLWPRDLAFQFTTRRNLVPNSTRALGWDTPSDKNSSAGDRMSRKSFGHTGFTGTSIWIDPERDLYIILLSNRVHPTRANQKIHAVRRQLADAVVEAFDRAANAKPNALGGTP
jgi:CubicO group peptidase (beta-lactamase class C family)